MLARSESLCVVGKGGSCVVGERRGSVWGFGVSGKRLEDRDGVEWDEVDFL